MTNTFGLRAIHRPRREGCTLSVYTTEGVEYQRGFVPGLREACVADTAVLLWASGVGCNDRHSRRHPATADLLLQRSCNGDAARVIGELLMFDGDHNTTRVATHNQLQKVAPRIGDFVVAANMIVVPEPDRIPDINIARVAGVLPPLPVYQR